MMISDKVWDLSYWALVNLFIPLLSVPLIRLIQFLRRVSGDWAGIIQDGQLCFYAAAILAASWYELRQLVPKYPSVVDYMGFESLIALLAVAAYGILVTDKQLPSHTPMSKDRVAGLSYGVAVCAIAVCCRGHWLTL